MTRIVRAAGGLVFRRTPKGKLRVLLVHRPSYDDWSLPKGKADKGETPEQTAVREVLEETGAHCRVVAPLGTNRYRIDGGVKEVTWFAMRPLPDSPGFKKNSEVDQIKWLNRKKARELLDYETERALIAESPFKQLARTGTLHLYRHASAGDRTKWEGNDKERPLTKKGRRQAAAFADLMADRGIERIVTSPYQRCIQSVEPLAKTTRAKIEIDDVLSEGPDIDGAYQLVDSLVGYNAIVCSHGDVIPAVINRMMWAGLTLDSRFYCSKGSNWEIHVDGGRFATGHYVPPPKV